MEDEIDLRKYIDVLLRHWKLIVSITVIAVIVAGLISFLGVTRAYQAKAAVFITKTSRAELVLEPKYQTILSEEEGNFKQPLAALVKSNSVATMAIENLGDILAPEEQNSTDILLGNLCRTGGRIFQSR